jgi:transcriptional regulator with GAF, ATPase, and Fis domain
VLITGETGTGKYELAKAIVQHDQYHCNAGESLPIPAALKAAVPLTRVLLTALPDTLAEAELFGYKRGAFTGAHRDHAGVFGDRNVQNILLDEIGDCSLALQAKLLQVIEDGSFRPVGAKPSETLSTNARIFLATRRPLGDLVKRGEFRDDLFYRIAPFRLHLPPLRDRSGEIPAYLQRMIESKITDLNLSVLGLSEQPAVDAEDLVFAKRYEWPGNLRQLSDAVQAWLLCACRSHFRDVVSDMEINADVGGNPMGAVVRERLAAVLSGARPPYDKIGDLIDDVAADARAAVYAAYHRNAIPKEEWVNVFTGQNLNNIRSAVSALGPGRNRERSPE